MEKNMVVKREPKTLDFDVGKNLKHDIESIIKCNESLAKHKIKNEIE